MNLFQISQVGTAGVHIEEKPFPDLEAAQAWAVEDARANGAIHHAVVDMGPATKLMVEVTDTYGGEANYSWVRRHEVWVLSKSPRPMQVRKVKEVAGWTGQRTDNENYGDGEMRLNLRGACQVMFIRPDYDQ